MKILFVTPTWPDPPNSGAKARMISILKLLKQITHGNKNNNSKSNIINKIEIK